MGPLGKKPAPPAAKAAALAADTAAAPPKPAAAAPAAAILDVVALAPGAPASTHAPAPAPAPLPAAAPPAAAAATHPVAPTATAHVTGAVHLPPSGLPVPSAKMTLTVAVPGVGGKPAGAELKHYEQVTQAMVMKDRRVPYKSKAKPMRSFNPNEVAIPENLKADEKDKLLQEIKGNDFEGQARDRHSVDPEPGHSDGLLGGGAGPAGTTSSPTRAAAPGHAAANGTNGEPTGAKGARQRVRKNDEQYAKLEAQLHRAAGKIRAYEAQKRVGAARRGSDPPPEEESVLRQTNMIVVLTKRNKELPTGPKDARQRVRKNDEQYAKLEAQLHRAAGKIRAYEAQKRVGAARRGSDPPPEEESVLRQTNMIVVLTKRNKELVLERKKMDELLHAKTVTAENEVRRCEKLERELESTRNKYTRDRTKLEAAMGELAKTKAAVDDRVRELERRLEAAARLRIAIEHQNAGLRDKLDSLMIDYSDVVNAVPIEDLEAATTSPRTERKKAPAAAAAVPLALSPIPPGGEDDAMKQARLAFEYEAWVKKKSEEAGQAAAHPAAGAGARGSRKPTKAAADEAKHLEMQRIEQERQETEAARKRQEEELARLEEERKKQEAENEARLQREAEEREKERQRRAEEELAKQEAEAAAAVAAAAEAKKKKKRWGGG
ncbi:hypothetical protein AMAG_08023 [Allomyces macrogynus ATCC 38327]|uniref:Uncharacterized protein n=1 Tax=Allomyces macrogynus (strain ATCC 38327) TaxID=578462 RepID=A0A0L0SK47_ALLM3|nr:hypothetical protein AMAG_08023 [Allomyces macrogynus ATCC 38327]|eukprot:KNE62843.1 hypothetical protein AMAG_08023 [Allomyces macrogynus ATCC 38327]